MPDDVPFHKTPDPRLFLSLQQAIIHLPPPPSLIGAPLTPVLVQAYQGPDGTIHLSGSHGLTVHMNLETHDVPHQVKMTMSHENVCLELSNRVDDLKLHMDPAKLGDDADEHGWSTSGTVMIDVFNEFPRALVWDYSNDGEDPVSNVHLWQ